MRKKQKRGIPDGIFRVRPLAPNIIRRMVIWRGIRAQPVQ